MGRSESGCHGGQREEEIYLFAGCQYDSKRKGQGAKGKEARVEPVEGQEKRQEGRSNRCCPKGQQKAPVPRRGQARKIPGGEKGQNLILKDSQYVVRYYHYMLELD